MTFYWPKVKTLIGFIYFMLSSSDFATGLCAGLHTLIFITMLGLKQSGDQSTSYIFILIAPSYFLSVVSFKVSAFVSMVFAVIRTIRIISPISSVVNKTAVVISIFVWLAIWVAFFLIETGVFIKDSKESEDPAEMKKNALIGHFYQPNKAKYIQDLFGSNNDEDAKPNSQGEMSRHGGVSAECAIDLLYTGLPVFLCAGITVIATIIQVVALLSRQPMSSNQEADRRSNTKLSITIILIGMVFIICSSCTLYQPFTVCFSDDLGAGVDRRRLYIMGYMPFFFNAASCFCQLLLASHVFLNSAPTLDKAVRKLLNSLRSETHLTRVELTLRSSLLLRAERAAGQHNSLSNRGFNMAINKFSIMTPKEKSLYLGVTNSTQDHATKEIRPSPPQSGYSALPIEFNHRYHGHVTAVKDQQSCGSCWAFAGVGAFEGSYSSATGVLKSFSEKEALDCSYPEEKDGCRGGWYTSVWSYIQSAGRLAAMTDIPYFPAADKCSRWKEKANGIKNADYIGHYKASSSSLERILTMYIPAAAFTVEDEFYAYKDGVYSGCETPKRVNHGVVIVGYAPRYWEVKNSWGSDWGDKGFAKFSRTRVNMCQITSRVMYTVVIGRDRGEHDQPDVIPGIGYFPDYFQWLLSMVTFRGYFPW
ncbi:uncharacterized protein LOC134818108 [Bolinopsis microptera]|uniref:uncharacterized protein LOC134818108 n=1 Tax=Bolinopsis microptera TaxID=2820187 RepID=UPI00307A04D0